MKIGVFDSGIGGITVLTELRKRFPTFKYVYLGDTAHVPYGTKSAAQIRRFSVNCARTLFEKEVDALVVACNTASAHALDAIKRVMGAIPVLGVVEPGVTAALDHVGKKDDDSPVLVLATRATVRSGAYGRLLRKALKGRRPVLEQECPLLVPMIEEGWIQHPILQDTIAEYVAPHVAAQKPGVALLGCTH